MKYEIEIKLEKLMVERSLNQSKLAELSGVSQPVISNMLRNGVNSINLGILAQLSEALGIKDIREIIDFKEDDKEKREGPQYFLVGTMYSMKEEHLPEWIAQNIWQLGWIGEEDDKNYKLMKKIWDDVEVGDYLIAKNRDIKKGYSGIRVKAIAKVVGKKDDGHTIEVEWLKIFTKKDYLRYQIAAPKTMMRLEKTLGKQIVTDALEFNKNDMV